MSPRQTRERRKISSITAPNFSENTVTAVPRRKISQTSNPRLPTRYDSRGGDNRRRKISNQLTVELVSKVEKSLNKLVSLHIMDTNYIPIYIREVQHRQQSS